MALLIPTRKPAAGKSFPTSPVDVAAWLNGLQPLSDGTSKRTLYRGLKHSNRLENSNRNRVEILRILEPAVDQVLDNLASQYSQQPLPLPRKPGNAHQLAGELLHELAFAWKIVVNDTYATLLGGQSGLRNIALFRAMRVLAKIILHNALVHKNIPAGLLHDANVLFKLAEESEMTEQVLELQEEDGAQWSVNHAYAHIQLLSLANLHCQRSQQIPLLNSLLERQAETIVLSKPNRTLKMSEYTFTVHLQQDVPATRWFNVQPSLRSQLRVFDCSSTLRHINQAAKGAPMSLTREHLSETLRRNTLKTLAESLSRNNERASQRRVTNHSVAVEMGIKEIAASQETSSPIGEASVSKWIVINESQNGLCLQWHSKGSTDLNVGEIIAIKKSFQNTHTNQQTHSNGASLGTVQWISYNNERLQCGIQKISENTLTTIEAALVEGLSESTSGSRIECLLVKGTESSPHSLISPANAYHESCNIRVHSQDAEPSLWLTSENLSTSGVFDQFSLVKRTAHK